MAELAEENARHAFIFDASLRAGHASSSGSSPQDETVSRNGPSTTSQFQTRKSRSKCSSTSSLSNARSISPPEAFMNPGSESTGDLKVKQDHGKGLNQDAEDEDAKTNKEDGGSYSYDWETFPETVRELREAAEMQVKAETISIAKQIGYHKSQITRQRTKHEKELWRKEKLIQELRAQIVKQKERVKKIQEDVVKHSTKRRTISEDDNVVKNKIKTVEETWKPWAKKWSISTQDMRDLSYHAKVDLFCFCRDTLCIITDRGTRKIVGVDHGASILLNAMLNSFVCTYILERPFFFLKPASEIGCPQDVESSLAWLYKLCSQDSEAVACACQAMLADMFQIGKKRGKSAARLEWKDRIQQMKDKHYMDVLRAFKESAARLLLKQLNVEETQKCDNHLMNIFREAGELSSCLWAQGCKIEFVMPDLLFKRFKNDSKAMEAHPTMLLDHDDTSLDGRFPDLVVRFWLKAFGNDEGQSFDTYRTWLKAQLWFAQDLVEEGTDGAEIVIKKEDERDNKPNVQLFIPIKEEATTATEPMVRTIDHAKDERRGDTVGLEKELWSQWSAQLESGSSTESPHPKPLIEKSIEFPKIISTSNALKSEKLEVTENSSPKGNLIPALPLLGNSLEDRLPTTPAEEDSTGQPQNPCKRNRSASQHIMEQEPVAKKHQRFEASSKDENPSQLRDACGEKKPDVFETGDKFMEDLGKLLGLGGGEEVHFHAYTECGCEADSHSAVLDNERVGITVSFGPRQIRFLH